MGGQFLQELYGCRGADGGENGGCGDPSGPPSGHVVGGRCKLRPKKIDQLTGYVEVLVSLEMWLVEAASVVVGCQSVAVYHLHLR